jgi:hypothetical protein
MQNNSDWRFSLLMRVLCTWLALALAGCDHAGLTQPNGSDAGQPNSSQSARTETANVPPKGMKVCFQCGGSDKTACVAPGCKNGAVDCAGPCLKLSRGTWEHRSVDGHPDTDLWQGFHMVNATTRYWNQNHVGEVIEMRDGMAENIGKCRLCGGTARAKCAVCGGTGRVACPICEGKGFVPEAWTAFNNPKQKNRPSSIQLKGGRTIYAKIESRIGSRVYIRTESGKQEELLADDIVSTDSGEKR